MKKLIVKFVLFCLLLLSVYAFALWQLAQGQVDYFYQKFTHKASSLIIGISRSNDGVSPSVLERKFGNKIDLPIVNFSFANQISDYGPIYLNAIQEKVKPGTRNGLFILEVNPASLIILKTLPDSSISLQSDKSFLKEINHFNQNPNYEYIRKMYTKSLYTGFSRTQKIDKYRYGHPDGWLEVREKSEYGTVTHKDVEAWKAKKLDEFSLLSPYYKPSNARLKYLEKTIEYLKNYGSVYLTRVPISAEFLELEDAFWPDFNDRIQEIVSTYSVVYLDYSKDGRLYDFYDGSHLFGHSAKDFTKRLCEDIEDMD